MKITFVFPDIFLPWDFFNYNGGSFGHGVASLSAVLKKAGHNTSLIHITREISSKEFQEKLIVLKPDLIAFSSTTFLFPIVQKYALAAKKISKTPIICGSFHSTLYPEEVLKDKNIDMICMGEGEAALLELCDKMEKDEDITNIESIWTKKEGKIYKNKVRPCIVELDRLPFPDREIFDYQNIYQKEVAAFSFFRGCPYNCTYCCAPALRKIYPNPQNYIRHRSPQSALNEIKEVIKRYPFIKYIRFEDYLISDNKEKTKEWIKEFSQLYQKEVNLPILSVNIHTDLIDNEILSLLKKAKIIFLKISIESGNNFILKEVLQKNTTIKEIKNAFKMIKKAEIKTITYNILGLPGEGAKEILDTIKLNAKISPELAIACIYYPFKGTALYNTCLQKNFIKDETIEISKDHFYQVLSLPTIRKKQIGFFYLYFQTIKNLYNLLFKISFSWPLILLADKILTFKYAPELIEITPRFLKSAIANILKKQKKGKEPEIY